MKIGNINVSIIYYLIFLFNIINSIANAQVQLKDADLHNLREDIKLITDRDIYCTNENLYFRAQNVSYKVIKEADWSKVLYIEIVTPTGRPVVQGKFEFGTEGTSGMITLPKEVLTGYYYLRAYTRWMRNYSADSYFYKLIKIINPFNKELLTPSDEISKSFFLKEKFDSTENSSINVKTDKKVYHKREVVKVSAILNDKTISSLPITISVIKKKAILNKEIFVDKAGFKNERNSVYYIPETRGLTLTGRIIDAEDSLPVRGAQVNLTIFNTPTKSYSIPSTNSGQFYFSIPYMQGNYEVFASINETYGKKEPIMMVDNDFCTKSISLPYIPINVNDSKNNFLNELNFNSQMTQFYANQSNSSPEKDSSKTSNFYGRPTYTINLKDYIELPTMQDYFVELLTNVGIRKKNNKRFFKISGTYAELSIYEPLVLVDFVPISNVEWVLSISPRKIKKIDIVETPFVRGNMIFGGIISIISSDGDFAGVNLPSSGQFFQYTMFSKTNDIKNEVIENKWVPDLRNLLYWNPNLILKNNEETNFQFFCADTPGEYYITIRGYSDKGESLVSYIPFEVQ